MRIPIVSLVIGALMLIGALPAAADPLGLASNGSGAIRLADIDDAVAGRDVFARLAQDEMQEWRRKLGGFHAVVRIDGGEIDGATAADLSKAWAHAEAASRDLRIAGPQNWEGAETSYEKASYELGMAWRKSRRDDK